MCANVWAEFECSLHFLQGWTAQDCADDRRYWDRLEALQNAWGKQKHTYEVRSKMVSRAILTCWSVSVMPVHAVVDDRNEWLLATQQLCLINMQQLVLMVVVRRSSSATLVQYMWCWGQCSCKLPWALLVATWCDMCQSWQKQCWHFAGLDSLRSCLWSETCQILEAGRDMHKRVSLERCYMCFAAIVLNGGMCVACCFGLCVSCWWMLWLLNEISGGLHHSNSFSRTCSMCQLL